MRSAVATEIVLGFGASPRAGYRLLLEPRELDATRGRRHHALVPAVTWEPGPPPDVIPVATEASPGTPSDDLADTLRALLALWREAPNTEVADVLDAASRLHLWSAGASSDTGRELEAHLDRLADTGDPADQPAFAAGLLEVSSRVALRLLGRWPGPDPRWTTELTWWLRGGRHDGGPVAQGIRDLWRRLPDRRLVAVVQGLDPNRSFGTTQWAVLHTMQRHFRPPAPDAPLSTEHRAWLASVRTRVESALRDRLALRDRVRELAATPDGPERLAVLADQLLEHADPYGRFLQLQLEWERRGRLSGALKNEMLALLRSHQAAWLHPLPYLASRIRTRLAQPESAHLASTPPRELFAGLDASVLDGIQSLTCRTVPRSHPPGGPWRVVPKGKGATLERQT